jgi:hypothetical protein
MSRLQRPRIVTHNAVAGAFANGEPCTAAAVAQTQVDDLLLGNGVSTQLIQRPPVGGVVQPIDTVTSQLLPIVASGNEFQMEVNVYDARQVFLNVHVVNFGGGGMSNLYARIDKQSPEYPRFWVPSLEGIARNVGTAVGHTITMNAVGNYVIASRQEHRHFQKVRFSFQADLAVDATTEIWVSWYTDGAPSRVTEVTN